MTVNRDRRVVVTGLGATTPVGGTAAQTWESILAGTSGARALDQEWVDQYQLPVTFAARLHTPSAEVLPKVEVRRNDPAGQYALIAAREAMADAGLAEEGSPEVDP